MKFLTPILLAILIGLLGYQMFFQKEPDTKSEILHYLDSIEKHNEVVFSKIDSLDRLKHEEYKVYEQLNLKYDTIQIAIDTMPDIDGTKYLLTISRQLTLKGVE
jgi:GTP-binding protein EngB required for normal cell division